MIGIYVKFKFQVGVQTFIYVYTIIHIKIICHSKTKLGNRVAVNTANGISAHRQYRQIIADNRPIYRPIYQLCAFFWGGRDRRQGTER